MSRQLSVLFIVVILSITVGCAGVQCDHAKLSYSSKKACLIKLATDAGNSDEAHAASREITCLSPSEVCFVDAHILVRDPKHKHRSAVLIKRCEFETRESEPSQTNQVTSGSTNAIGSLSRAHASLAMEDNVVMIRVWNTRPETSALEVSGEKIEWFCNVSIQRVKEK